MSERAWRFVQGGYLLVALYLESHEAMMGFLALVLFEGITNLRVPKLVNFLIYKQSFAEQANNNPNFKLAFEAERLMRLSLFVILYLSYFEFYSFAWFFPWFMASMLILAAVSKVCPMVMFYRFLGFR